MVGSGAGQGEELQVFSMGEWTVDAHVILAPTSPLFGALMLPWDPAGRAPVSWAALREAVEAVDI